MYCKHIFTTSRIVLEFLFSFTKIISICCYAGYVLSPMESSIRMTHYPSLPFSHPCTFHTVIVIFVVAIRIVVVGILIFYQYYYCLLFLKFSLCVQIHFIHIFSAFHFQLLECQDWIENWADLRLCVFVVNASGFFGGIIDALLLCLNHFGNLYLPKHCFC